jgi:hypothetical protein
MNSSVALTDDPIERVGAGLIDQYGPNVPPTKFNDAAPVCTRTLQGCSSCQAGSEPSFIPEVDPRAATNVPASLPHYQGP